MDIKDLSRIDLNTLVALEALLEERNVSKAAERLFVTQSAMSKTLGRLRLLFDDQLFLRTSAGMQPTPRAQEIATLLPAILQGLKSLVQPAEFNPSTYKGEFTMVTPDYIAGWLLPPLFNKLTTNAPGIQLNFVKRQEDQLDLLAKGELDFLIQIEQHHYPVDFSLMTLGLASPRLFVRKGHPLEGTQPSWEEIEKYPQIEPFVPEGPKSEIAYSMGNSSFLKHLRKNSYRLMLENVFVSLRVVQSSDGIFLGPPLFAELNDLGSDLITLPFPEEEDITLKFILVRHERVLNSPPHQYLFQQLIEVVETHRMKMGLPNFATMRKEHKLAF